MRPQTRHFPKLGSALGIGFMLMTGCAAEDPNGPPVSPPTTDEPAQFGDTFTARAGTPGTMVIDTINGPETVEYRLIDGERVFQGDIVLPPDYRSGTSSTFGLRWPNGIVPYENSGLASDARVKAAIAYWQARLPVFFIPNATAGNRIKFVTPSKSVCNSWIGMAGGAQVINLASACNTGAAIHEIGHALGLFHEQSRSDRDGYVKIITTCIQAGFEGNFNKFSSDGWNVGAYDVNSIMHYNSNAFLDTTKPACTATITRTDGTTFNLARNDLTGGDIAGAAMMYQAWRMIRRPVDWDLDGLLDKTIWRPSTGEWWVVRSSNGVSSHTSPWGVANDVPVPADYDGDGIPDPALFRPTTGQWFIRKTTGGTTSPAWGTNEDVPVPGRWDSDAKVDVAVWRPSNGTWYIAKSTDGGRIETQFGVAGDIPVPGDYDGDGRTDIAVWRPSNGFWYVINSSTGARVDTQWGQAGDIPVPADYDGIFSAGLNLAIFRPSTGEWWIKGGTTPIVWGQPGDVPVPGRYLKASTDQIAVWRPKDAVWYVRGETTPSIVWGASSDVAVP